VTNLSNSLDGPLVLQLSDTLVHRLTKHLALVDLPSAASTANADTVDDVSLLGSVSKAPSLLRTSRPGGTMDAVQLAQVPGPDAKQKTHSVCLLLAVNLLHVLVGTHFGT
jgi:hypothetical protein